MHYATHERDAFLEWLNEGCPDEAVMERHYEPVKMTALEFLRYFVGCTDTMPATHCEELSGQIGYPGNLAGMSYSTAAQTLLIARRADEETAVDFLQRLASGESRCDRCGRAMLDVETAVAIEWEAIHRPDMTVGVVCPGCMTAEERQAIDERDMAADEREG